MKHGKPNGEQQQAELLQETLERTQKHVDALQEAAEDAVNTPAMEELLAWNRCILDGATALSSLLIAFRHTYRDERKTIQIHEAATAELLRERDVLKIAVTQLQTEKKALLAENAALIKASNSQDAPDSDTEDGLPAEAYLTDEFIGDFEKVRKVPVIVEAAIIKKEITIATREGTLKGYPDDRLMRGIEDELYPCGAAIFAATYEHVNEEDTEDGNGTGD